MRAIRVLHVTTSSRIGGAERLIADCARSTSAEDCELTICTLLGGGELARELAGSGAALIELGLRHRAQSLEALLRLVRIIRAGRYDVVHAHLLHGGVIGLLAARAARVPLAVTTRHHAMHLRWYGTPLDRALERLATLLPHRIFAISEAVRDVLVRLDGVRPDRVEVVPNGISVGRIDGAVPPGRVARSRGRDEVVLGTIGTLHPRKGQRYLIEAVALLRSRGIDARATIIGDGPLRDELRRRAAALGVAETIRFEGHLPEPYALLADVDIYVQPSVEEGFGIAVLEAMTLERPVVASAVGGLTDVVVDGVTGLLVPPRDASSVAEAVLSLLPDPARQKALGRAGRERVATAFTAERTSRAYLDAYRKLLQGRTRDA